MPLGGAIAIGAGSAISGVLGMAGGKAQANAAKYAANLQYQLGQQSLSFQQQQYNRKQQNIAPWLKAGTQGINSLSQLLSTPGQGLLTPWTEQFQAPTGAQAAATPGYQFALQQGQNAVQNSAAARGGLLSTGAQKTLDQYSQGLADQTYSDTYNRALGEYQQRYNIFQGNQSNEFNRLAALSGIGQTATSQLGTFGQQAASNIAGINANTGAQVGNSINLGAAATASGYAGLANSINGGISNVNQYMLLQQLLQGQGGGAGAVNDSLNSTFGYGA
jgi:hypothetical protein